MGVDSPSLAPAVLFLWVPHCGSVSCPGLSLVVDHGWTLALTLDAVLSHTWLSLRPLFPLCIM